MTFNWRNAIAYCAVAALAFLVYVPALWCGFVEFDDPDYVYRNEVVREGVSLQGVAYAFTSTELANWFPLTLISHMIDASIYSVKPAGHHLTNMLLHAINSALLLSVLMAATRAFWPSVAIATLFAVHPLHVESVVWIAERKDMLGAFFFLATVRCYLVYVIGTRRKLGYLAAVICFAAALMSKPVPVTLPFVLLLLDVWPLERFAGTANLVRKAGSLAVEKIPFFALSGASIAVTLFVQSQGGATGALPDMALKYRLANAALSYCAYIGDAFWPAGLSPIYPHPRESVDLIWGVLAAAGLAVLTIGALLLWRKRGYFTTGWFIFVGMLVPMIGIVQVGYQARADRYMHLPIIGLLIVVVFTLAAWAGVHNTRRRIVGTALAVATLAYGAVTIHQISFWKDSETLFVRALAVTEDNFFAHEELGLYHYREGRLTEAEFHYNEALRLGPEAAALHANLAAIQRNLGRPQDALIHAQRAVEMAPDESAAHGNLGWVLRDLGGANDAAASFTRAIELDPENIGAHYGLALLLAAFGQNEQAMQYAQTVLKLNPNHEGAKRILNEIAGKDSN